MCGIVAILDSKPVNQALYDGLTVVQHRGQDAAGIMTSDGERVFLRKDNGLVQNIFHTRHMLQLSGHMGIGHTRYPTAGTDSRAEAQPFYVNSPFGIALGHNGNLTNAQELSRILYKQDLRQLNTNSDSEILLNVFAHELREAVGSKTLEVSPELIFKAVTGVYNRCRGAFAVVAMIVGGGILAFRDPYGIRPLAYGTRTQEGNTSHYFASESAALDVLGYELDSDVRPGEAIFVDMQGQVHRQICAANPVLSPCIFEFVYLARPDSVIDSISVYQSRINMGEKLGAQIQQNWPDHDIDVVIPIPDTSRTAANEIAQILQRPFREGFVKNRYIGRTFIMPGQEKRQKSVRQKLNTIAHEFTDKNVLLVDDSIVRGTTSKQIINLAREAGAKNVYFASAAPPVRYANVYGIDMPSREELVAHNRNIDEIAKEIGADRLFYQELADLEDAVRECNQAVSNFDSSCFDGNYITGDVSEHYLQQIDTLRNDKAKSMARNELDISEIAQIADSVDRPN